MSRQNKTQKNEASVEEFLDSIKTEGQRKDCKEIALMMHEITGEKPDMWGTSIVGYGRFPYTYASGRSGEWFKVGFSPRKNTTTLYLMTGFDDLKDDLQKLGKHSTGKSCLYIKSLEDIDKTILKKLIEKSAHQAQQYLNSQ